MVPIDSEEYNELLERNRMLSDIALSAVALKLNLESGFAPNLDALNRDLGAFQRRFGGIVEMTGKAVLGHGAGGGACRTAKHRPALKQ